MAINSSNKSIIYPSGTTAARPSSVNNGYIYFNTTIGALQIYQNGSWYVLTNINAPGIPTSVTATDQGSGRSYNDGKASVAFTPATETFGFPATYTITPTPTTSPSTFTGSSSPIIVTGLASSTQYTYVATATNNTGTSSASSSSSGVTATTVPQAPTIGAVTGGNAEALVAFTPGATGGASATYTATSNPGNITATGSSSPITVTGLTNGTSYTFTVTATNANGTSSASSASSSITPSAWAPESGYDSLATVIVPSGGLASITFAGIPSGYTHLQIRAIMLGSTTGVDAPYIRYNGDTGNNYTFHSVLGEGASARSQSATSQSSINVGAFWFGLLGSNPSSSIIDILNYSDIAKYKTTKCFVGQDNNATYGSVGFGSGLWQNTSAINSLTIFNSGSTTFSQYSSFALYGVK